MVFVPGRFLVHKLKGAYLMSVLELDYLRKLKQSFYLHTLQPLLLPPQRGFSETMIILHYLQ